MASFRKSVFTQSQLLGPPSKIVNTVLHKAVIEFGEKNSSWVPVTTVKVGGLFRRSIDTARIGNGSMTNWIFSEVGGDVNRYDGKTVMGNTNPAIYVTIDTPALNAEGLHYSDRKKYSEPAMSFKELSDKSRLWLASKTIVTFRATCDVKLADFRMNSPEGMEFLKKLNQDAQVRAALAKSPFGHIITAMQSLDDYSVSRALAYVADKIVGADGVTWNTARISRNADRFADNATVKGEYKKPVSQLRPIFLQEYYETGGKTYYIAKKLDNTIDLDKYAHFPEGQRV
jgi:hypothetical protein